MAVEMGSVFSPADAPVHHTADRWAHLVWAATEATADPKTLYLWARLVGVSVPTLRGRCYMAGVSPRVSLDLMRILRAIRLSQATGVRPADVLDICDPRTVRRLLVRTGLSANQDSASAPTVKRFLEAQSLVTAPRAITALRRTAGLPERRTGSPVQYA